MHQDILNKRQSEIELINGFWQQAGTLAGLSTVHNSQMVKLVQEFSS